MIAHRGSRGSSSRLAGYLILGAMVALAACGLYVASWGVLDLVPFAAVIIGAGIALQVPFRLAVLAAGACLALGKGCASRFRATRGPRWRVLSA